ncbi:MAG: beta-galactosidase [Acetatifactor sp.]|nr:beta-galactosidase [Acetatifactor sp.]
MEKAKNSLPWYQRTRRWCQTNLTEIDARDCHVDEWKKFWLKNKIQGIVVNAGGIVAYFPSKNPDQYRSKYLGNRDLLREFCDEARGCGITVLARMDINRATGKMLEQHPEWFAVNEKGEPYRAGERFVTCLNSGYYKEYIPKLLEEIIQEYHPDGITDNSWWGADEKQICHCDACKKAFFEYCGELLPKRADWKDQVYRRWIAWNVDCRMDNWKLYNEVTQRLGGHDCLWMGMVNANPMSGHGKFSDLQRIAENYGKCLMTDHQCREEIGGFEQNSMNGMLLHSLAGDQALIPESMANYNRGKYLIRRAANPAEETRMWMLEGISGGLSPWTHFVGGVQEDRRMLQICTPVMEWHERVEKYLYDRTPVYRIGLGWSHENIRFYGREDVKGRCELPWKGFSQAMVRARLLFSPVNCHQIEKHMEDMDVLILPDLAVITDSQAEQIEAFCRAGKSVIVTGATGDLDELGDPREQNPVLKLLGIRKMEPIYKLNLSGGYTFSSIDNYELHNYMRLREKEHPVFAGIGDTDIVTLSGQYYAVKADSRLKMLASLIPAFPTYPPEISYMEDEGRDSSVPVILAGESNWGGRVVYLAADLDRRYGFAGIPDHGRILGNCVRWALGEADIFESMGNGYIDCKLYRQEERWILHMVNLSGLNLWPGYAQEHYAAGPNCVKIKVGNRKITCVRGTAEMGELDFTQEGHWISFMVDKLVVQELFVIQ